MKRIRIGERLRSAREQAGFSRDSACAKIGVSRTTLQQWENGATEASIEALDKLAKLYKTTPQFLIFGETSSLPSSHADDEEYEDVLVYDVLASAGVGNAVFEENASCRLKFPSWWFAERRLSSDKVVGLYTKGDSMEPTIPDNSLLLLNRSQVHLLDGKIYVIRIEDELYVKRVKRLPLIGGVQLISDNTDYKPIDLNKQLLMQENFFDIIGQVVHIGIDLPH